MTCFGETRENNQNNIITIHNKNTSNLVCRMHKDTKYSANRFKSALTCAVFIPKNRTIFRSRCEWICTYSCDLILFYMSKQWKTLALFITIGTVMFNMHWSFEYFWRVYSATKNFNVLYIMQHFGTFLQYLSVI